MQCTVASIPLTFWGTTLWVTHFVSCPLFALQIWAGRFICLTGRPTEARWTLAAELVRIIWHTFATVLTNAAVCDALAVGSSKTHWAAALRAALYLHALSTILTAQTGTGEDFKITTVEASEILKEQQRGR